MKRVAFFAPEIAVDKSLKTYAGGLGFVAGDFLRAAYRRSLPLVGLTILWRHGFYNQKLGPNGMEVEYPYNHYHDFLEDTGKKVRLEIGGNPNVWVKIWLLKPDIFKTTPIFYLDVDIPENDALSKNNTKCLYAADYGQKLAQEIILGIGGVRALQELQIPVDLYHLNEGYCCLAGTELLRQKMTEGLNFQQALENVRRQVVFTTHTPEMTGSETYDLDTMIKMKCFPGFSREEIISLGGNPFSLTVFSLKIAMGANAVSQLHGQVANRLWSWVEGRCPIIPITNGVDTDFWQWPEIKKAQTPEEAEKAKAIYKGLLLEIVKEQSGKLFDRNVLTIVWARRFAEYKRPWLLFYDRNWFKELLESNLVQIIYAGKPHPADLPMINLWNEIWQMSKEFKNLVILPGYDLEMSKILKGGADLWINTPRRPREACGTSWMSAMMNCTPVLSSRDGGTIEGIDTTNGFLFGIDNPSGNDADQDNRDFQDFQYKLQSAVDVFYKDKTKWYAMALIGREKAQQDFSSDRMLNDYVCQLYG